MEKENRLIGASCKNAELIGFTAAPDLESARKISEILVKERLAACAQVGGQIESFYEWNGEFCRTAEIPITFKLLSSDEAALFERLKTLHPYECPEWVSLRAENISSAYAKWMRGK